ncbi:hypothetical protein DMENIID0001_141200 [Sergentomyia squamirostris]
MDLRTFAILFGLICMVSSYPVPQLGFDGAQDPNAVDESVGWSWGVSRDDDDNSRPSQNVNQPSRPVRPNFPSQQQSTGSAVTPAPTEPSESFFVCMDNCRTTNQYNPVCGSDNQNYHNMDKLDCAVSCGANVRFVKLGTCQPVSG